MRFQFFEIVRAKAGEFCKFPTPALNDPDVPMGTLWANARMVQPLEFEANPKPLLSTWTTWVGSEHCGSSSYVSTLPEISAKRPLPRLG